MGCGYSVSRCGRVWVIVNESAEQVAAVHRGRAGGGVAAADCDADRRGRLQVERTVRPTRVVVTHVDAKHMLELPTIVA